VRSIGRLKEDGALTPTLLAFDEVWKIRDKYPRILDVIRRGARVSALRPDWSLGEAIEWLAAVYPRGLAAAGLVEIDERLLKPSGTGGTDDAVFIPTGRIGNIGEALRVVDRTF
jgi:hypothetical protein